MNPRRHNPFQRFVPQSFASLVVVSFAIAPAVLANTELDVAAEPASPAFVNPPSLNAAATYTLNVVPDPTSDITFNASNFYSQPAPATYVPALGVFAISPGLSVGSVNSLSTTQAITITNGNTGTQAPLTLNGGNSVSGNAADLLYVATGATLNISNIKPNGGAVGNTVIVIPAVSGNLNVAGTSTISVPIASGTQAAPTANTSAITKTGTGTLFLTSNGNNFTGGMTISDGVLQLGNGGATGRLALATPIINNANLTINRNNATTQGTDFSNAISGSGSFTQAGIGATSLNSANTYTGTTTIENGNLIAGNAAALGNTTSPIALGNANSITSNLSPFLSVNGNTTVTRNITVGASDAATTGIYKIGTGNAGSSATLSGVVTLKQNLTVSATNQGGGTFTLAGSVTSGSSGTLTVTFDHTNALVASTVIGGGSGSISVTKIGTGTTTLSGTNTYTGPTTVTTGTLIISGNNSAATGAVTVAAAATLGGNGNIGGAVTIGTNGTHALAVALTPGAQVTRIIGGSLTHSGTTTLNLTATAQPGPGNYTLVTANSPISVPTTVNYTNITGGSVNAVGNSLVLHIAGGTDYDDWIGAYTFAPGADTTATGDPDHDGQTNQQEYAFGLAPNSGTSSNPIISPLSAITGEFVYTRRKPTLTSLTYGYEYSTDLSAWIPFAPLSVFTNSGDPVEAITVSAPPEVTGNARVFIRVKAQ